ncbi:MAG: hypothetical protein PVH19_07320 [Planctomycetia bacterium]|jgi:endonuclease-3
MAAPSRATQFGQMHKVLKKHYKATPVNANRSVLEHALFACLAENAQYQDAEEAYAAIVETYYDWNEVRVTTIRELAEGMPRLPDPPAAAARLRRVLQHVFENGYVFDLEYLRKQNLGPTVAELQKIDGMTPFAVSYVVQSTLGGHSIPLDSTTLQVLYLLGFATDKEVKDSSVAGLERAIPKNKGVEFGSLLHELAADFLSNPFAAALKKIMIEINPEVKDRLPKRGGGKRKKESAETKPTKKVAKKKAAKAEPKTTATKKKAKAPVKKAAKRKIVPTKKKAKAPVKEKAAKKAAAKKSTKKKVATKKKVVKKSSAKKTAKKVAKKKTTKKSTKKAAPKKRAKGITKRKPR